jgi:proline- and glutamine-rich splicing factor
MKKQKLQALEREMKLEEDKLVAQMEFARYEHETEHLRAKLREREASREQHKSQWEAREREMSEMLKMEQERRVREEEQMSSRMLQQDANIRQRQQENSLFMQAQELSSMLDRQEAEMRGNRPGPAFGSGLVGPGPVGPGPFINGPGANFRGGPNKPLMGDSPGFGGPTSFNNGFGTGGPPFGNDFGGPGLFNSGQGGPGGPGPRRWENDNDLPNKRRRF